MHFLFLTILFILFSTPSHAYLDPGMGGLLIQGLIAAIAAVTTFCSVYWRKIKEFFTKKQKKEDEEEEKK
ncbi:hypothetical protein OA177_01995 [Candidatus Pelagibacter sp.]|nr:hypothetical protein [Candidatus Pelagibacter sp.]